MIYLQFISIIPLFIFIVDGYYEKNIKKGVLQILAFLITAIAAIILVKHYRLTFIVSIPVLLIIFLIVFNKNE